MKLRNLRWPVRWTVRKWIVQTYDGTGRRLERYRFFTRTSAWQQFSLERGALRRDFAATGSHAGVDGMHLLHRSGDVTTIIHTYHKGA